MLQPDIRGSTLNSSAGKLAIAQEGRSHRSGSTADACSLQPCRSQAAMGITILSIADSKLCIDNKSRVAKDGNPTWLYQFQGVSCSAVEFCTPNGPLACRVTASRGATSRRA